MPVDRPQAAGHEQRLRRGAGGPAAHDLDVDVALRARRGSPPSRRARRRAQAARANDGGGSRRRRAGGGSSPAGARGPAASGGRRPIWMSGAGAPVPASRRSAAAAGLDAHAARRPRRHVLRRPRPGSRSRPHVAGRVAERAKARRWVISQNWATIASGSPCSSSAAPAQLAQSEIRLQRRQTAFDCHLRARSFGRCSFQPSVEVPLLEVEAVAARELAELEVAVGIDREGVPAGPQV